MTELKRNLPGLFMRRSLRSYLINAALRLFVKPRFKSPPMSGDEMRKFMASRIEPRARYLEGIGVREEKLAGMPARWIEPPDAPDDKLMIYLHGGAFVVETPNAHTAYLTYLTQACGINAVMPSYRLAPEHPFPAAVDDCLSVYKAVLDQGYDPRKIVLAGDSAGGNLALVTLQQARDAGLEMPACAVFISPGMDLSGTPSQIENAKKDPSFNKHAMGHLIAHYLKGDYDLTEDPRVSPLKGDFSGLPPMLFITGSTELFRDCSVFSAQRAEQAGVYAMCHIWRNMPHCFPVVLRGILPEADEAMKDICAFILSQFDLSASRAAA